MRILLWALAGAAALELAARVPLTANPETNRLITLGVPGAVALYALWREGGQEAVAVVAGAVTVGVWRISRIGG